MTTDKPAALDTRLRARVADAGAPSEAWELAACLFALSFARAVDLAEQVLDKATAERARRDARDSR